MWAGLVVGLFLAALTIFQGLSILTDPRRPTRPWSLIMLDLCIAAVWFLSFMMLSWGILVVSPEFGNVMVQGSLVRCGLALIILGIAISFGLIWSDARIGAGLASRFPWPVGFGLVAGLVSISGMHVLAPKDVQQGLAHVYAYDLWWPPLLIWGCLCLAEGAITMFRISNWRTRYVLFSFLVAVLGLLALQPGELSDPLSERLWILSLMIAFSASLTLAWLQVLELLLDGSASKRMAVAVLSVFLFDLGLSLALAYAKHATGVSLFPDPDLLPDFSRLTILATWLSLLVIPPSLLISRKIQSARNDGTLKQKILSELNLRRIVFLLAVFGMLLSIEDLLYSSRFEPTTIFLAFIVCWLMSVEASGGRFARYFLENRESGSALLLSPAGKDRARQALTTIANKLGRMKETLKGWLSVSSWYSAIFKTVMVIILLIALCEVPNAGKTFIEPFKIHVILEEKTNGRLNPAELGQLFADCIAQSLATLREELRPDVIQAMPGEKAGEALFKLVNSSEADADIGKVLAKSPDLDLGSVKIPVDVLAAPVQIPMRSLLKVRTIRGSVYADSDGYTVFASSTRGERWRAHLSHEYLQASAGTLKNQGEGDKANSAKGPEEGKPGNLPKAADKGDSTNLLKSQEDSGSAGSQKGADNGKSSGAEKGADKAGASGAPNSPEKVELAKLPEALLELADQVAFEILISDPLLIKGLITHSWDAYQSFKHGLMAWNRFQADKDYDALSEAVWWFRTATVKDPEFSLAYYRLGLALQKDGQPMAAAEAFRRSMTINPASLVSRIALASTLYDFDSFILSPPMAVTGKGDDKPNGTNTSRRMEAVTLWNQVIEVPISKVSDADLAPATYGLCRHAYEDGIKPPQRSGESRWREGGRHANEDGDFKIAYYYCKRSAAAYTRLSSQASDDVTVRSNEATVFNQLGTILDASLRPSGGTPLGENDWVCRQAQKRGVQTFVESNLAARRYYDRALALDPSNIIIRCNAARSAFALGDLTPMQALKAGVEGHTYLARDYFRRSYYVRALQEYQSALSNDPTNLVAMNEYAYTFWSWRYHGKDQNETTEDVARYADDAESRAQQAIDLRYDQTTKREKALLLSTFGEVLLGKAQPQKAVEPLDKAQYSAFKHAANNELRWNLAMAYLCTSVDHPDGNSTSTQANPLIVKADQLLEKIRDIEKNRENTPFSSQPELLDRAKILDACRRLRPVKP